jgi:hypothetical protein
MRRANVAALMCLGQMLGAYWMRRGEERRAPVTVRTPLKRRRGGATGVDVTESPTDGGMDDIAWRASDIAVGEHVLHRVRDGVYHRVHGR